MIYEYALVDAGESTVTAQLRPPALPQTCRKIRAETRGTWYTMNTFLFTIRDCDARFLMAWADLVESLHEVDEETVIEISGQPNWANLLGWCRTVCDENCLFMEQDEEEGALETVIATAHAIAARHCQNDWPWSECEKTLEDLHLTVGKWEPKWLQ